MAYSIPGLSRGKTGSREINKRIPTTGTPTNGVKATATLSLATQPTADDTITIGTTVYTFVAAGTAAAAGEVNLGANIAATKPLLVAAINGDALNDAHPDVVAGDFAGDDMVITAKLHGTAANSIVTTTDLTDGTDDFGAATMSGGVAGTAGEAGEMLVDDSNIYLCMSDDSAASPSVWRKVAHSALS